MSHQPMAILEEMTRPFRYDPRYQNCIFIVVFSLQIGIIPKNINVKQILS